MECDRRTFLIASGSILLVGCGAGSVYRPEQTPHGDFIVPLTAFGEEPVVTINHRRLDVPIVIARVGDGFVASELLCPHQGCVVSVKREELVCPCHGSAFTFTGEVTLGPADEDLKSVPVIEEEGFLLVQAG